jgi:hypothetical protein
VQTHGQRNGRETARSDVQPPAEVCEQLLRILAPASPVMRVLGWTRGPHSSNTARIAEQASDATRGPLSASRSLSAGPCLARRAEYTAAQASLVMKSTMARKSRIIARRARYCSYTCSLRLRTSLRYSAASARAPGAALSCNNVYSKGATRMQPALTASSACVCVSSRQCLSQVCGQPCCRQGVPFLPALLTAGCTAGACSASAAAQGCMAHSNRAHRRRAPAGPHHSARAAPAAAAPPGAAPASCRSPQPCGISAGGGAPVCLCAQCVGARARMPCRVRLHGQQCEPRAAMVVCTAMRTVTTLVKVKDVSRTQSEFPSHQSPALHWQA